jgi:flagellar hook assembly protein FlgD
MARFDVPSAGPVRVSFYDAAGRLVATPLDQSLPAGAAEVRWDGRDAGGQRVPAGVLFARVQTAAAAGSIRAVVLR